MRIDQIMNIELWEDFGDHYPLEKQSREYHGLVYFLGDTEVISIDGHRHVHSGGEVVYLPQYARYRVELPKNHIKCYVINFTGEVEEGFFFLRDCRKLLSQFETAERLWRQRREDLYYRLDCTAIVYQLFAELLRRRDHASVPLQKKERLAPALERLHEAYRIPDFRVASLAPLTGMSERALCRLFSEVVGCSPKRYLDTLRLEHAKELLTVTRPEGQASVSQIAAMVGFRDIYHFSAFFKHETGDSPLAFRQHYSGSRTGTV